MRQRYLIGLLLPICLMLLLVEVTWAQKKTKNQPWTSEEKEVLLIPTLANQGHLSFNFDAEGFYVQVEPLFWQKSLHRHKVEMVKAAMQTARFMNKEKNTTLKTVMFFNMTTHEELAYGFIGGLHPGKYEILK